MLETELREGIEERLAYRRVKGHGLTRGGWYNPEKMAESEGFGTYCTSPIRGHRYWASKNLVFFYCFNGEAPVHSSDPHKPLEGGALSLKWLKYMTGELSPCPGVVEKIENLDDLERMNAEGGFIISDYTDLNAGELCFFLITQRFCQEQHARGQRWADLVDLGVHPRIAFIMAHSFQFCDYGDGLVVDRLGASSHSGFHDFPQWWAKNYYEASWRGPVHKVGVPDGKIGYGKHYGLGRPGASIGLDHPKRDNNKWDQPPGYGFFDAKIGMGYKELEALILEDVERKDV